MVCSAVLFLAACSGEDSNKPEEQTQLDTARSIDCTLAWSGYDKAELEAEVGAYESLSDPWVTLSFVREINGLMEDFDVDGPLAAFTVVSSEQADDSWVDLNNNLLWNTVFSIDLDQVHVDEGVGAFFGADGFQDLQTNDSVWLHAGGGTQSVNMVVSYDEWEGEAGFCQVSH